MSTTNQIELTCQECGKVFLVYPARLAKGPVRFCSMTCYGLARRGVKRDTSAWGLGSEERVCPVCGETFLVGGHRGAIPRSQRTCSENCSRLSRYRQGSQSKPLSVIDAAYIAGFIDGEGSIMLYMRRDVVAVRFGAYNTNWDILAWLADVTGVGSIAAVRQRNSKHAPSWQWHNNGDAAESILRQIRPYLRIKAAQADLAIETQERLRMPALKADRTWQADYRARMQVMNRKGPAEAET